MSDLSCCNSYNNGIDNWVWIIIAIIVIIWLCGYSNNGNSNIFGGGCC